MSDILFFLVLLLRFVFYFWLVCCFYSGSITDWFIIHPACYAYLACIKAPCMCLCACELFTLASGSLLMLLESSSSTGAGFLQHKQKSVSWTHFLCLCPTNVSCRTVSTNIQRKWNRTTNRIILLL